ncbi:MAG: hypothetical protein ACI976_001162, partial [Aureispira sp.]
LASLLLRGFSFLEKKTEKPSCIKLIVSLLLPC